MKTNGQGAENISTKSTTNKGKQLAKIYCSSCHLFTEPQLLDRKAWEKGVLPNMALRLGLKMAGKGYVSADDPIEKAIVDSLNIYPESPLITENDWMRIKDYYLLNAPEKMPIQKQLPNNGGSLFPFEEQWITIDDVTLPQVTLLEYDVDNSILYVGDGLKLYGINRTGALDCNIKLTSPSVDIAFPIDSDPLLLTIGKLAPSDQKKGGLFQIRGKSGLWNPIHDFSDLKRPVSFEIADLNSDGKKDIIICSFGHNTGKLAWYDSLDSSKEHILSLLPGARKIEVRDLNSDGKPDIVALAAQARERITIYFNKGNGNFEERPVLEFSPLHGTSYFELADFNNDGHDDLLVTNGDNRDFSSTDKPYHGVRIYLNDGDNKFKETYFFPMYDCNKAMARDFDNDGDLDIVAASFYTDYTSRKKANNAFVYLENSGNFRFLPSFPTASLHGNWLTMEVADFDKDGLLDVMLGAFLYDITEMVRISSVTGLSYFPQVLLLTQAR